MAAGVRRAAARFTAIRVNETRRIAKPECDDGGRDIPFQSPVDPPYSLKFEHVEVGGDAGKDVADLHLLEIPEGHTLEHIADGEALVRRSLVADTLLNMGFEHGKYEPDDNTGRYGEKRDPYELGVYGRLPACVCDKAAKDPSRYERR